jgi:hypothetical protein
LTNNLICYEDIAPRGVHEDENEPVEVDVMKEEQQPNLNTALTRTGIGNLRVWVPTLTKLRKTGEPPAKPRHESFLSKNNIRPTRPVRPRPAPPMHHFIYLFKFGEHAQALHAYTQI